MILRAALLIALTMGCVGHAATLGEEGRFEINAINATDFEVIRLRHMGASELWCAAASHVRRERRLPGTTPIYVRRPLGPSLTQPGRRGVVFSLRPDGLPAPQDRLTLTVAVAGETMIAGKARSYCRDAFTRSTK